MRLTDTLDDITVLEVGSTVVGPYATQALGAMGADVVKVEPPGGDSFRGSRPQTDGGFSGYFAMCNCEKRSLRLDLKRDEGVDALHSLVEVADVIVINLRPGVPERLGIDHATLSDVNPDLIYCSITGFGRDGPWSERPAFDPILQGMSGLMSVTGPKGGPPVRVGVAIIDLVTAIWTGASVVNAVRKRDRTGEAGRIEMNMYESAMSLLTKQATMYQLTGENPVPMGTEDIWAVPYGAYPTADDRYLIVGAAFPSLWERMCHAIDRSDLIEDDRFRTRGDRVENREALNEVLTDIFSSRPLDDWMDLLGDELPVGPILKVGEALESEQAEHDHVVTEVEHDEYGPVEVLNLPLRTDEERQEFDTPPPTLGEHSREVLSEAGISDDALDELEAADVI